MDWVVHMIIYFVQYLEKSRRHPCEHLSPPMSPSPQTAPPQAATCKTSVTTFSPPIYNTNQSVSTSYLPA